MFFHRPSNLSLIAINHRGKQMLGTKATWRGGGGLSLYMCMCVWLSVCTYVSTYVYNRVGGLMKLSVRVTHKS